ncbi:Polyol transporter 5 [Linum perenne]
MQAGEDIREDLKLRPTQLEFYVTYMSIGPSIVGALLGGGVMANYLGRRYTMGIGGGIYFAGVLLVSFTANFVAAMLGRALMGAGIGIGLVIGPVYIAEIAPAPKRGQLSSFPQVYIYIQVLMSIGMVLGTTFHLGNVNWRVFVGLSAIPSAILMAMMLIRNIIPDTPCWLVAQEDVDDAANLMKRCGATEEEVNERMGELKHAQRIPSTSVGNRVDSTSSRRIGGISTQVTNRPIPFLRSWFTATTLFVAQEMVCEDLLLYNYQNILAIKAYAPGKLCSILKVAILCIKLICSLIPVFIMDRRLGRKWMLLVSMGVVCLLLGGISGTFLLDVHQLVGRVPLLVMYSVEVVGIVGFGAVGLGAVSWFYGPEVFPYAAVRAPAVAFSVAIKLGVSLMMKLKVPLYYPPYVDADPPPYGFFVSCAVLAIAFLISYVYFKERKGKTLEDDDHYC